MFQTNHQAAIKPCSSWGPPMGSVSDTSEDPESNPKAAAQCAAGAMAWTEFLAGKSPELSHLSG